jgi:hypothetical protein
LISAAASASFCTTPELLRLSVSKSSINQEHDVRARNHKGNPESREA